ncbi:MAG: hypothetical protein JW827_04630 [Spirochaetes bacterium]|nr:hypothetical protein [Spirochaetota bacterium]
MIEQYEFGKIVIHGKTYTSDIIILPDNTIISWWRNTGHNVINEDLEIVYHAKPNVLVLGCGAYGVMRVSNEVKTYCDENRIKLIMEKSKKAVELFNAEKSMSKAAGFHLTC